ncbi:MAG: homocysteine S-methyltransferase family protein, partial [Acidimicrobiales bacterium]|nr:homocysteine S-methyltransferase family protein [Acidimicrobiales bacterium]
MNATSELGVRLANSELILIDGATGTDIERRGVPMVENAWCGVSALTHGDDVRAVHRAHIDAGAELIIANTYASSRHLLARAGEEEHFAEINRRAVALAIEARDQAGRPEVLIAGSMSTSRQGGPFPDVEIARANFAEQAIILTEAGVDIIVLEMMRDIEQTEVCLEGALATGLPVWLGVSCVLSHGVPWMWERTVTLE